MGLWSRQGGLPSPNHHKGRKAEEELFGEVMWQREIPGDLQDSFNPRSEYSAKRC